MRLFAVVPGPLDQSKAGTRRSVCGDGGCSHYVTHEGSASINSCSATQYETEQDKEFVVSRACVRDYNATQVDPSVVDAEDVRRMLPDLLNGHLL